MPNSLKSLIKPHGLGLAVVATVAITAVAVAYWTGIGSGTAPGTASSGGTISLGGSFPAGIAPGLSSTVSFTATNATTSAIQVGTVSLVSIAADAGHSSCAVADLTMPSVIENQSIAAGATAVALTNTGTVSMANTAVNQDACKGATFTLTLSNT